MQASSPDADLLALLQRWQLIAMACGLTACTKLVLRQDLSCPAVGLPVLIALACNIVNPITRLGPAIQNSASVLPLVLMPAVIFFSPRKWGWWREI